jgi:hypothetical protein
MHGRTVAVVVATIATPIWVTPASAEIYFAPPVSYPTGSYGHAVEVGDVTGDGRADVLLTTAYSDEATAPTDYKLQLFAQRAEGGYAVTRLATSAQYSDDMDVALGDLDGDGDLDAAVAAADGVDVFRQSAGTLQPYELAPVDGGAQKLAIANLDGAGPDEIVVGGDGVSVLSYTGSSWTARPIAPLGAWEIEAGDLNADARPDLVVNAGGYVKVLMQAADGFTTREIGSYTYGIEVADVTGDGRDDVVLTSGTLYPETVYDVFPQTPAGVSGTPISYQAPGIVDAVEAADMDRDGRNDVVTEHSGSEAVGILRQGDTGLLEAEHLWTVPFDHYGDTTLALGDVDSDGRTDIAMAGVSEDGLTLVRQADPPPPGDEEPAPEPTATPTATPTEAPAGQHHASPTAGGAPAAVAAAPASAEPQRFTVFAPRTARARRGAVLRVACRHDCRLTFRPVVRWRGHALALRRLHRRLAAGRPARVRIAPGPATRRELAALLRRGAKLRLEVQIDGGGARRAVALRLRR